MRLFSLYQRWRGISLKQSSYHWESSFEISVNDFNWLFLAGNTKNTLKSVQSFKSFQELWPLTLPIMRFSASTCYIASLVAALVLVTTSLPQPTSNTGLPSRPSFFQPSRLCPGLGSSGTTARALDPRAQLEHLPCEVLQSGAVTKVFSSSTSETVELLWHFESAFVIRKLIRIIEQ